MLSCQRLISSEAEKNLEIISYRVDSVLHIFKGSTFQNKNLR